MLIHRITTSLKMLSTQSSQNLSSTKSILPNFTYDFSYFLATYKTKTITSGRSWKSYYLRLKSNEDLHKLWFVCVKEKNTLLADQVIEKKFSDSSVLKFRINKVKTTMDRILAVIKEREIIRKEYREKLYNYYIEKKRYELKKQVYEKYTLPYITWQMLREKYLSLRKGIDNTKYLERIWQEKYYMYARKARMNERLNTTRPKNFKSFWEYEMTIGERPLQEEVLRTHIRNWKSLNLKQRKIILGFLNAKRSRDAKATFLKYLRILGDKIAQDQVKYRINSEKTE